MIRVELDTFLVTLKVPRGVPVAAMQRILSRPRFQAQLRQAIAATLKRYATLKPLTVTLSR